jgi:hypothetical protein
VIWKEDEERREKLMNCTFWGRYMADKYSSNKNKLAEGESPRSRNKDNACMTKRFDVGGKVSFFLNRLKAIVNSEED